MDLLVVNYGDRLCIKADPEILNKGERILREYLSPEMVRNIRAPKPTILRLPSEYLDGPGVNAPALNAAGGVAVLGLPGE